MKQKLFIFIFFHFISESIMKCPSWDCAACNVRKKRRTGWKRCQTIWISRLPGDRQREWTLKWTDLVNNQRIKIMKFTHLVNCQRIKIKKFFIKCKLVLNKEIMITKFCVRTSSGGHRVWDRISHILRYNIWYPISDIYISQMGYVAQYF